LPNGILLLIVKENMTIPIRAKELIGKKIDSTEENKVKLERPINTDVSIMYLFLELSIPIKFITL